MIKSNEACRVHDGMYYDRNSRELNGAAKIIGFACALENRAFVVCKKNASDPKDCLKEGKDVTNCVESVVGTLHAKCGQEYEAYANCLVDNPMKFELCREEQFALRAAFSAIREQVRVRIVVSPSSSNVNITRTFTRCFPSSGVLEINPKYVLRTRQRRDSWTRLILASDDDNLFW